MSRNITLFDECLMPGDTNDFVKKYHHSFLQLKLNDTWYVAKFKDNPEINLFEFETEEHGIFYLKKDTECELRALFPNQKVFQHKDKAYMFGRIPARMWKKAPHTENCYFRELYPSQSTLMLPTFRPNIPLLEDAFNPRYTPLSEVKNTWNKSTAISKYFSVTNPNKKGYGLLYIFDILVGQIDFSSDTIISYNPYIKQELEDLVQSEHKQWHIKYGGTDAA